MKKQLNENRRDLLFEEIGMLENRSGFHGKCLQDCHSLPPYTGIEN